MAIPSGPSLSRYPESELISLARFGGQHGHHQGQAIRSDSLGSPVGYRRKRTSPSSPIPERITIVERQLHDIGELAEFSRVCSKRCPKRKSQWMHRSQHTLFRSQIEIAGKSLFSEADPMPAGQVERVSMTSQPEPFCCLQTSSRPACDAKRRLPQITDTSPLPHGRPTFVCCSNRFMGLHVGGSRRSRMIRPGIRAYRAARSPRVRIIR